MTPTIKIEQPTMTDNELMAINFETASTLIRADKQRWADLHNKGANLYSVNMEGKLIEVPACGWWY